MFFDEGGRHYSFAKYLLKEGYNPVIFCSSEGHNNEYGVEIDKGVYRTKQKNDIKFVFIKTTRYEGNGISRIRNMLSFYWNVKKAAKQYARSNGSPDIILASSVHPLTLIAGIKTAKKFRIKCICEIRDLWPETLVAYGSLKRNSIITKLLYLGERWIYKKADSIIFTLEGARDYLVSRRWDTKSGGPINLEKVYHICNGVDLDEYINNQKEFMYKDEEIEADKCFKVIYIGSMGQANALEYVLDAAKIIIDNGYDQIEFVLFGGGPKEEELKKRAVSEGLENVTFRDKVDKKYVPSILKNSNLNIITGRDIKLFMFGISPNKLFDYFASGKPTVSNLETGYDALKEFRAGITVMSGSAGAIADAVISFYNMPRTEYDEYCKNALLAAHHYDYKVLTNKLISVMEGNF